MSQTFVQRAMRLSSRIFAAVALVAAITFFFFRLVPVNETTAGFFYLVAILLIATAGGFVESAVASIVAMLCFNYFFLPPIRTFAVTDPRDWVALFAFLATSLTAQPALGAGQAPHTRRSWTGKARSKGFTPSAVPCS